MAKTRSPIATDSQSSLMAGAGDPAVVAGARKDAVSVRDMSVSFERRGCGGSILIGCRPRSEVGQSAAKNKLNSAAQYSIGRNCFVSAVRRLKRYSRFSPLPIGERSTSSEATTGEGRSADRDGESPSP